MTSDGIEALEKAVIEPPQAIVSDVLMPRQDGFQLCTGVRENPRLAGIPVLLQSSNYAEAEDRALARAAGATDLIVRTPDSSPLVVTVERVLVEGPQPASPSALSESHPRGWRSNSSARRRSTCS